MLWAVPRLLAKGLVPSPALFPARMARRPGTRRALSLRCAGYRSTSGFAAPGGPLAAELVPAHWFGRSTAESPSARAGECTAARRVSHRVQEKTPARGRGSMQEVSKVCSPVKMHAGGSRLHSRPLDRNLFEVGVGLEPNLHGRVRSFSRLPAASRAENGGSVCWVACRSASNSASACSK